MSKQTILGIDPGIAGTGLAVIALASTVEVIELASVRTLPAGRKARLRQADDDAGRLRVILTTIDDLIKRHRPMVIAYETPLGSKGARAAKSLAYVVGGVVTLGWSSGRAVMSVTPAEAKVAAADVKTASKRDIFDALTRRFDLDLPAAKCDREHALDALGVALAVVKTEFVLAALRAAPLRLRLVDAEGELL